jgi:hypothetical protein
MGDGGVAACSSRDKGEFWILASSVSTGSSVSSWGNTGSSGEFELLECWDGCIPGGVDGGTTGSCEVGSVAGEGTTCWVALLVCWLLKKSMHVLFLER